MRTGLQPHSPLFVSRMGALGQVLPLPTPTPAGLRALPSMPPPAPWGIRSTTLYLRIYECPGLLTKGSCNDTQHNFGVQESFIFLGYCGWPAGNCKWKLLSRDWWWHCICGPSTRKCVGTHSTMVCEHWLGFRTAEAGERQCSLTPPLLAVPLPRTHVISSQRTAPHLTPPSPAPSRA